MFCIPIMAYDNSEALTKMEKAASAADVFEIRLDTMEAFDLKELIDLSPRPVLVTYRSRSEGGRGILDPEVSSEYLLQAVRYGADYIDIELTMPSPLRSRILRERGSTKVIISKHIESHTPSLWELEEIFKKAVETGGDIIKIVAYAKSWEDNLRIVKVIPLAKKAELEAIAFCMGQKGRLSRVISHLMGGAMSFTPFEYGEESAYGQIPVSEMKKILRYFNP